jgi:2-polyprenyl-3-methyl-5-hydroxy-6-metoxy-1,4-benzoquinol methylase
MYGCVSVAESSHATLAFRPDWNFMSRLNTLLLENYTDHYGRVNASTMPTCTPQERTWFARNYGALVAQAAEAGPAQVLDVGCGTGKLLACLKTYSGITAVGVDISPSQTAIARRALPELEVETDDGLRFLRRNPNRFAGIICNDVLEHLDTLDDCLALVEAANAALLPGGFFACRAPNGANILASYSRYMDLTHHRCFTATSMVQLLEAGGLTDVRPVQFHGATWRESCRLALQHAFHLALFYLTGRRSERFFTPNIHAVGFRSRDTRRSVR